MKTSNKKVTRNEQVNLVDLFYYLVNNWIWFLISVIVCLGIAYLKYARTTYTYQSSITAVLKNQGNETRSARLDTYSDMINAVSVTNEELQLQSVTLMSEVVKALDADVYYTEHIKFRNVELYKSLSPVLVKFSRNEDDPGLFSFNFTPLDERHILADLGVGNVRKIPLGDTVKLGKGYAVFVPTDRYDQYYGHVIRVRRVPVGEAAGTYVSRLDISHTREVLTLVQQDYNAQRVADILNMLVIKYNQDAIREKNRVAVQTANFIDERLRIIEDELGSIEGSLAYFKSSNNLMDVSEAASNYLSDSRDLISQIAEVETRLALVRYLRNYILNEDNTFQMIPANTGLEDANIDNIIGQFNELILRREKLVAASSTESPAVKQIEGQLSTLRHNILGLIGNLQTSLDVNRKELAVKETITLNNFSTMPSKERQMLEIQRQQSIKQELYLFLLNKREENALSQAMADDNIRVIDAAGVSYTPVSPARMKMMALALLIGLIIPAGVLIARLFLDTKIRTRKEIEANIDVPFLAEIPLNRALRNYIWKAKHRIRGDAEPSPFVYESNSHSVFTEAMRMMCTNLSFLDPDCVPPLVIGTTSYSSASGKTFIVANMAACLADAQKRVVVIDTDMRKRSLSGELNLKHKTVGLSNYLYDLDLTLEDILHKDVKPGIDFIPAGATPPNPGELLSRPRFDDLIKQLRGMYDYIILDGVPVQMLSEPLIVNRVVDCNLFILRSGQLDRRILPQLDELNEKRHLSNMAIVFNGPEVKRRHGYGFGSYGYGYGYGYGSGNGYYTDEQEGARHFWDMFKSKK